jgi:hypothetical protein
MDIGRILARSLEIAWRYKFLWLLGFVMALTGGSGGGGGNSGYNFSSSDFNRVPGQRTPTVEPGVVLFLLAVAACLLLIYLVLVFYFRFVARGALVASVRAVENGTTPTLGSAWREGQSYYVRLLGLGFLVNLPLIIVAIALILLALLPFLGSIIAVVRAAESGSQFVGPLISGLVGAILLFCCALLCILLLALIVHPIYEFAVRAIVLENTGTIAGLSRGYNRLRANLGNTLLLYIVLIGARIGWSIVVAIVAIPTFLVLFGIVVATASANLTAAILFGLALGIPLALVFVFVEGLFQVFESNAWTEGYLALLTPAQPAAAPGPPAEPTLPLATA